MMTPLLGFTAFAAALITVSVLFCLGLILCDIYLKIRDLYMAWWMRR